MGPPLRSQRTIAVQRHNSLPSLFNESPRTPVVTLPTIKLKKQEKRPRSFYLKNMKSLSETENI